MRSDFNQRGEVGKTSRLGRTIRRLGLCALLLVGGVVAGCGAVEEDAGELEQAGDLEIAGVSQAATARFNTSGCEAWQMTHVTPAANKALTLLQQKFNQSRYTRWFDVKSTDSFAKIARTAFDHVNIFSQESLQLLGAAARQTDAKLITFNCKGNRNSLAAHVTGPGSSTIHLDAKFWDLPVNGRDTKAGTIIHELSHLHGTYDLHPFDFNAQQQFDFALGLGYPDTFLNANNYQYYYEGQ